MKVLNKLASILFDYDPDDEIPVITESSKEIVETEPKRIDRQKNVIKVEPEKKDDEVVVTKIETVPVTKNNADMPKFNSVEEEKPKRESNFTFPIIDDEEDLPKKETRTNKKRFTPSENRNTKKYDYLSSTNYKEKTETRERKYEKTETKKPFTLSPIISPVFGILNENYTKEDIVSKDTSNKETIKSGPIDLDSVRRKAYGTLEDEIEVSLNRVDNSDVLDEVPEKEDVSIDNLKDDGLSIHDLLVDEKENNKEEEIFDINMEENANTKLERPSIKKNKEKEESGEEEDLFDLIDSIYAGKEE